MAKRNYSGKRRYKLCFSVEGYEIHHRYKTPDTVEDQHLADEQNEFYCRFENRTPHTAPEHNIINTCQLYVTALQIRDDVRHVFRDNKRRKAPGPDGVTLACLKTCADQLPPPPPHLQQINGAVRSPLILQTLHHHPRPKETQKNWTFLQTNVCGHEII